METEESKTLTIEEDFGQYFKNNLKLLSYVGLTIDLNDLNKKQERHVFKKLIVLLTNSIALFDGIFQIIWLIEILSSDVDLAVKICTDVVSNVTSNSKGFRLITTTHILHSLLTELVMLWREYRPNEECYERISTFANRMLLLCKFYMFVGAIAVIFFALPPLQNILFQYLTREGNDTYDFSQRVFYVRYPFEINSIPIYLLTVFQEIWLMVNALLYWICCDTLFIQLTTHVSLQFEVLNYDLQYAVEDETDEGRLKECLITFIKRHRKLLRFCDHIETIYSPIVLIIILLSSISMCVNMYQIKELLSQAKYADLTINVLYLTGQFLQIIIYCSFAETLTQKSVAVADAVYNCNWTGKNRQFRTFLQILIMKSQIPFYCTALGLFPIDLSRLTWTFKTAISFFMMLEATSE